MTLAFNLVDPDDPRFKGNTWEKIEAELQKADAIQWSQQGYDLDEPEDNGPSAQFPSRPLYASFPWEEKIENFAKPASCKLENWKHSCLTYAKGQGCATLTLKKAALDPEMLDALQDAVMDLRGRHDVRVVVLRSEGKQFCSGFAPTHILAESEKTEAQIKEVQLQFAKILYFLSKLPQFVFGLAQGSAMGDGVGLLCACDMVASVKGAFFAMNQGRLGVVPSVSLPFISRRFNSMTYTKQLVLAGVNMSATDAKEKGLIQEVVEDLDTFLSDSLAKMTNCAPGAVAATKEAIMNTGGQAPSAFLINYITSMIVAGRQTPEYTAGIQAVTNRTKPAWASTPITA